MKFTLEIELGNDAMRKPKHVASALKGIADTLSDRIGMGQSIGAFGSNTEGRIRDINGNTVGKWEVIDESACAVCGVSAPEHGHFDATDPKTHKWVSPSRY